MSDLKASIEKRKRAQRVVNAYHRTFGTEDGQIVLADLCEAFGWNLPTFLNVAAPRSGAVGFDTHHAAKRDGQRDVKLHIEAKLAEAVTGDGNIETAKPSVVYE